MILTLTAMMIRTVMPIAMNLKLTHFPNRSSSCLSICLVAALRMKKIVITFLHCKCVSVIIPNNVQWKDKMTN